MTAPQNGTARWQLWISAASTGILVVGSMIGLLVQIASLSYSVGDLRTRNENLEKQVASLEIAASERRLQIAKLEEHQTEIETQMRSADQVRNLMHANDLRVQSLLWEQAFKDKSHYPTDNAYYPSIAAPPR